MQIEPYLSLTQPLDLDNLMVIGVCWNDMLHVLYRVRLRCILSEVVFCYDSKDVVQSIFDRMYM